MKKLTTKEDISNLLGASTSSIALGAAIETGLLQILAEKPMDGESLSQAMNIPGKRGHYWLQILTEIGILELVPQGYIPSSLTRTVILDPNRLDRWKHTAADERERLAGLRNLASYLSEPGSIWEAQGLANPKNDYEKMIEDPERAHVFTRLLYNFYRGSKDELADLIDMTGIERMMDVGGGSGIASILLAQKYPNLTSVVVDLEYVCREGIKIVEENHLSDRIVFHGANFLTDELPKDFDMVLHCDIGVFGEGLFRKLREALKPGGRIVVVFHFPSSENSAPEPYLKWAFLDSLKAPDFGFPTVAQVQAQLVQAGFRLLPGEDVLTEGQIVIQAQKIEEQKEMTHQNLSASLAKEILDYLDCPAKAPTLRYLNRLINAYIRRVPWESVSRIVKRHTMQNTKDCPRLPEEFWSEAMQYGFGGTCYESSLAFYSLLIALGYEGYLTVNDMGDSHGCHAAIILLLNGKKYLVDITIPVHRAVQINPQKITGRKTSFHDYTIRPVRENTYEVERSHHPHRNAFTLIDLPVSLPDYRTIVENDYKETGFFLKSVVMTKVIDDKAWRFFSDHKPYKLESFNRAGRNEKLLKPETLPNTLAGLFNMPEDSISTALAWISSLPVAGP